MPEPLIQAKNIEIIYNLGKSNEYKATAGVSFDIYQGEYIILFGPSGCGKSTIMYSILGALPTTAGEIIVKGINPYKYTAEELVSYQQSVVGIIYQAFYLIPSVSVRDNVMLPQIFAGVSPVERERRGNMLLTRFGVAAQADKLPLNLSGGQQQRVAVARSIVGDPEILLADEPVGNLDSISADQVMDMLGDINVKEKKTVILVTHDAKYLPYAHRVFYLRDGLLERIVINPEKEQIMTTEKKAVVTEIEKLARIHPYLDPGELKVKSVINYLTQELTFAQIERLESAVRQIMDGRIDEKGLYTYLVTPLDKGGAGIMKNKARNMAMKTRKILEESRDITRYRRRIEEDWFFSKHRWLIKRLRTNLLDAYEGQVSLEQLQLLEVAISQRIMGELQREDFQKELARSFGKGGIGFNPRTARNMTIYLEKLLAQGAQI